MSNPAGIEERIAATLVNVAGGFLRNTVHVPGVTCQVCRTTVNPGFNLCYACEGHRSMGLGMPTADHVGMLTYAIEGKQSHYLMRGYKSNRLDIAEHRNIVSWMTFCAMFYHLQCLSSLSGIRVTHWATVPSLPAKSGEHPLHAIVSSLMAQWPEVELTAALDVPENVRRFFRADHFRVETPLPSGVHVLVIDDTWTSGGHAQSAALSIRKAGAARVSIMNLARYFKEGYGDNAKFVAGYLTDDYHPAVCPWTSDGVCP
jgi:hypothetical protein